MKTWRSLFVLSACFALLAVFAASSEALEEISFEHWASANGVPYGPSGATIRINFDARITESDLTSGVTFSVVERSDAEAPSTLLKFVFDALENLPPAGTPAIIGVEFNMMCDDEGRLVLYNPFADVTYCHPEYGTLSHRILGVGRGFESASSVTDRFTLALVDEDQIAGGGSSGGHLYWCTGSGVVAAAAQATSGSAPPAWDPIQDGDEGGSIGIFFDAGGTLCAGTIEQGVPTTVYVMAKLSEALKCGTSGAEFRFGGIPDTWATFTTADTEALLIGDPFGDGVVVTFPCVAPSDRLVPLFSVLVVATDSRSDFQFTIEHRDPPSNSGEVRPFLLHCDKPRFTKIGVQGLPCWVNPAAAKECATVAVETHTWSRVKSLFVK